jgi:hypothetical protein
MGRSLLLVNLYLAHGRHLIRMPSFSSLLVLVLGVTFAVLVQGDICTWFAVGCNGESIMYVPERFVAAKPHRKKSNFYGKPVYFDDQNVHFDEKSLYLDEEIADDYRDERFRAL